MDVGVFAHKGSPSDRFELVMKPEPLTLPPLTWVDQRPEGTVHTYAMMERSNPRIPDTSLLGMACRT